MMVYGGMWGWKELVKELREVGLGIEELIRKLAVMLRNLGEEVVVEWVEWEKIWEEDREDCGRWRDGKRGWTRLEPEEIVVPEPKVKGKGEKQ